MSELTRFGFNNALACQHEGGGRREGRGGRRGRIRPLPAVPCVSVLDLFEMLLNTKGVSGMIERGITH